MLLRLACSALFLTTSMQFPAHAIEPDEVVAGIYAAYPWQELPPGGHEAWYMDTAIAWGQGAAEAGKDFLVGSAGEFDNVATEVVEATGDEARVRAVLSGADGKAYRLNFGLVGDDDEDDRWRVIEVFTDDDTYLSEVLARP